MTELMATLRNIVGDAHVLDEQAVALRASHFWDASPMQARALVKPANTDEVSNILKACHAHGQAVVTHGGLTGLVDGERSDNGEIVLSLERMRHIENIDPAGRTITVQAGCVLENVQHHASEHGLLYGLDLGARGSCTIGGNIATNAGGLSVLRYGMTREQVLGLEVVLADGTVLSSMNALLKNNTGYDLKQWFVGSEGTLGVVTRAVLRLRPDTPTVNTAIVAFDNFEQVSGTLSYLSGALNAQLNAFEIIWNEFYRLSTDDDIEGSVRAPLSNNYNAYAIIECRGAHSDEDQRMFIQALEDAMEKELIVDAVIAQSEKERADIWTIRENVDLVLQHDPAFIYDISLPIASMDHYLEQIKKDIREQWPNAQVYAYGHLADSNLHLSIAPKPENFSNHKNTAKMKTIEVTDASSAMQEKWNQQCNKIVFEPLSKLGGSVSAEHGIGLMKKSYLHYSRTDAEITTMGLIKRSLDPKNILNPGKIVSL